MMLFSVRRSSRCSRAAQVFCAVLAASLTGICSAIGANVTLAWDLSTDPSAAGYTVYYGPGSRVYTNAITVGNTNYATVPNLLPQTTYYFAATTYNVAGLESDFSAEVSYAPPGPPLNVPPTLDPIAGLVLTEGAGLQTVQLTGISSGSGSENQTLTVSAFSDNLALIPNPSVNYVSPNTTGSLSFAPVEHAFGSALITVLVDDGGTVSNTVMRSFSVNVTPVNDPPTLDPIDNLVINQNAGPQTVPLSGISSGSSNENQTLTLTASSSNPALIPNPVVSYTSPNTFGTLTFTPAASAFGTAVVTVSVSDGQPTNATVSRTFSVTVNQLVVAATIITNVTLIPNQAFRLALLPPYPNGDRFTFSLDATAPAGATIASRRGVPTLMWTPSVEQSSTTNLIVIHVEDLTTPTLSTNEAVQAIVLDYLGVLPLASAVEAGQTATMPLYVASSGGVTNLSFIMGLPTNRFSSPALTIPPSVKVTGAVQLQGTNLQVNLSSQPGRVMTGSNLVGQLSLQALANQSSAFVNLPVTNLTGSKPTGANYAYSVGQKARIAVVNVEPLMEWAGSAQPRLLTTYGRVGTNYVLQSSTNLLSSSAWTTVQAYTQTNIVLTLPTDATRPLLFYRLKRQ